MIDIHSHILPGIDDGALDLEEAVAMCRMAASAGCEAIIATPHQRHPTWWNTEPVKLQILLDRVMKRVDRPIRLYMGAEIRVDPAFIDLLDRLEASGLSPLAGSSYLLLEFQRGRMDVDPLAVVKAATEAGWRPIIAHPEFIQALSDDLVRIQDLVDAGALLQVTAMSVTANFGKDIQTCALALIDAELAHFVASDAHGTQRRPPGLKKARTAIIARCGNAVAKKLLVDNPQAILEDRPIEATADS